MLYLLATSAIVLLLCVRAMHKQYEAEIVVTGLHPPVQALRPVEAPHGSTVRV